MPIRWTLFKHVFIYLNVAWLAAPTLVSGQPAAFFWGKAELQYRLTGQWEVAGELIHRRKQDADASAIPFARTQTNALRLWTRFRAGEHTRLWLSPLAYFSQEVAVGQNESLQYVQRPEWRWSGGVQHTWTRERNKFNMRNLAEWRHFPLFQGRQSDRVRFRHLLEYDFRFAPRWQANAWNEFFWNAGPELSFDQNRTGAALQWAAAPHLSVIMGYFFTLHPLERWQLKFGDHNAQLYLIFTLDNKKQQPKSKS